MTRAQEIMKKFEEKKKQLNNKNFKEISNLFKNDKQFSDKLQKVMEIKK